MTMDLIQPNRANTPHVIRLGGRCQLPHVPSAKTQTLGNKAFPVIDHHGPSQEMPKWAMRDSTVHAFKAVNIGLLDSSETEAVSPADA